MSLISIVIVFLNKSYLKYKLILGIIIIGFALPLFGSLMNGLSYSTDRWTFIMQFFFSFTVVMVLDDNMLFSDNKKEYYLMIIPVCLCILQITNQEKGSILRGILYLLLSLFLYIY